MSSGGDPGATALEERRAWEALQAAGDAVGVDVEDATLRRIGTNAVFVLGQRRQLARVASMSASSRVQRSVRVATWLEDVDFPANRLVWGVRQPVEAAGCLTTFWVLVGEEEHWAALGQVGDLIRRLHWLEEPASLGLQPLDPLGETWGRIKSAGGLSEEDRGFLWTRAEALAKAYDELDFVLPRGMVHGDASVGNVLLDDQGDAVLIDLDGFAVGPREWDLVLTALYFERYGWHSRAEYDAFVYAYGFDVMNWYGYQVLADMRELMMTVWLSRKAGSDSDAAAEVQRRIGDLRNGADRHGWRPF